MEAVTASNTLLDVLATLIGFSAVMLLLSILVTGAVQFLQGIFQVRAKNLVKGVAAVLHDVKDLEELKGLKGKLAEDPIALARKILEKPTSPRRNDDRAPGILGVVSWVKSDELIDRIGKVLSIDVKESAGTVKKKFESIHDYMSDRFIRNARFLSVLSACIIAIAFQINSLELFRNLSADPELRARFLAGAEQVEKLAASANLETLSYQEVSDMALSQLGAQHPAIETALEEVSGVGDSREEMVRELRSVIGDVVPDSVDAFASEYEEILDDHYRKQASKALDTMGKVTTQLAYFNIDLQFWPQGWAFFGTLSNWLGLLMTIGFISLGAPFWFKRLQGLTQLYKAIKGPEKNGTGQTESASG